MDQEVPGQTHERDINKGYELSGKIMLATIATLFSLLVLLVCFHLYVRWYLHGLRRRNRLERRRQRRTHIVFHADTHHPSAAADRGLDPAVLYSLPVSLYAPTAAAALECAVCLSEFEQDDAVRLLPKCGHSFHIQCIDMWFHSHSTCPLCRSAVEPVVNLTGPAGAVVAGPPENASGSEEGSSEGSGLCTTCQHEEGRGRSKANGGAMGLRLEAAPPSRAELENELTQSSPGSRFLSLKRLLSMNKKSPRGGGAPPQGEGTSGGGGEAELDLEGGLSEPLRGE